MRTPIPHYSPQSSRPRAYTVVALWQAHFSQLAGGQLVSALLASTAVASSSSSALLLLTMGGTRATDAKQLQSAARGFALSIVFEALGHEGERSANATLITKGRAL